MVADTVALMAAISALVRRDRPTPASAERRGAGPDLSTDASTRRRAGGAHAHGHVSASSEGHALPPRARLAVGATRTINGLSRRLGHGGGTVIGGRAGLMIDPTLLARLAAGRTSAL